MIYGVKLRIHLGNSDIHTRILLTFPMPLSLVPLVVSACEKEYLLGLQGDTRLAPLGARLKERFSAEVVVRRVRQARA